MPCWPAVASLRTKRIPMKRDLLASIGTDASPLAQAAKKVLREALDRVELHPCDQGDDTIAAKELSPELQALLQALIDVSELPKVASKD
ncbi:TPA: hypothetical protein L4559_003449 [Pseudomonas aeruginosa]|nr:hypothetical protein [Pseudomonas aeruginosa]